MLEILMRLYTMAMAYDVRSPMPHLVGPAGCGKSTSVEQLADLLDVNLHVINVSRISPLDIEGVQMPHGTGEQMMLRMLPARWWTQLKEGDILLMDEFLRGFPEVYNGLLDIFTSRRVGAFRLPKVFIIGASNSVVAYDQALEDRLMHIKVPDPRSSKVEKDKLSKILVDELGLLPAMARSMAMTDLLDAEVLPMYDLLDSFKKKGVRVTPTSTKGTSIRNLIGQVQLRHVVTPQLKDLLDENNRTALAGGKPQYVVLFKVTNAVSHYEAEARKLKGNPRLTPLQARNLEMNLQLIELEKARREKDDDDAILD